MSEKVEIVECDLVPLSEYDSMGSPKTKFGRYHKTNFWDIKGYGSKKWVVAMKIVLRDSSWYQKMTDQELLSACFEYLNTPPPRKKYAKKDPKPKYGFLTPYKATRIVRGEEEYISALAIVSERKNRYFWGKGKSVH